MKVQLLERLTYLVEKEQVHASLEQTTQTFIHFENYHVFIPGYNSPYAFYQISKLSLYFKDLSATELTRFRRSLLESKEP